MCVHESSASLFPSLGSGEGARESSQVFTTCTLVASPCARDIISMATCWSSIPLSLKNWRTCAEVFCAARECLLFLDLVFYHSFHTQIRKPTRVHMSLSCVEACVFSQKDSRCARAAVGARVPRIYIRTSDCRSRCVREDRFK